MHYKELLKKTKKEIALSAIIFIVFAFLGAWYCFAYPNRANTFFGEMRESFIFLTQMNFSETFLFIFFNNTLKVFLGMILGIFFGIIPILFLIINGFVIGFVATYVYSDFGIMGLMVALAPHGVFELAALFIGSGYGIYLGFTTYRMIKYGNLTLPVLRKNIKKFKLPDQINNIFKEIIDGFVLIVLPLLLLAAIIETVLFFCL